MQEVNLGGANLRLAGLVDANLYGARLGGANLNFASLGWADLQGAYLRGANLKNVYLTEANLKDVDLRYALLEGANLEGAILQGTYLRDANLLGANLRDAIFDKDTCLPDNTFWKPNTEMTRFTDPTHPDFWPPEGHEVWKRWHERGWLELDSRTDVPFPEPDLSLNQIAQQLAEMQNTQAELQRELRLLRAGQQANRKAK